MELLWITLRVIVAVGVIVAAIWYVQKRYTGRAGAAAAPSLTVVGRQGLGAKASVVLLDADGKRFLLGVTEHGVSVLHTGDAPPAPQFETALAAAVTQRREPVAVPPRDPALARFPVPGASAPSALQGMRSLVGLGTPGPVAGLDGSLLSPATWRRAASVFRTGR